MKMNQVYSEIGLQGVDNYYIDIERGLNTAQIFVRMKKNEDKYIPTSRFIQAIQPAIEEIPEMQAEFISQESTLEQSLGDLSGGIVVLVKGPELDLLESISSQVLGEIEQIDGLYNAKTSFRTGRPEINISLDRTIAAGLDITMDQVITAVRNRISESLASEFHYEGDDRDIRVAFPKISQKELENIRITTGQGAVITLKNVAEFNLISSPKEILREEQVRIGMVTADIKDDAKYSDIISQVNSKLESVTLPRDYNVTISGEERERQQSFSELRFALILAVILVYMVLASLFESFIHPFTIMLAVPMAGIGSVLIFLIIGKPLSIMAFIGIIMLAGIAVNDAIIFVDYINTLRSRGENRIDAILQAGQDRLRPIVMTSLTTILALVPLIIGIGEGASLRAPLAYAVIGGLTTSTMMTLILTPCLYLVIDNLRPKRFREQTVPVNTE
jgi:HAE1 family hydrophobic/amphiphilic exporter-1